MGQALQSSVHEAGVAQILEPFWSEFALLDLAVSDLCVADCALHCDSCRFYGL